MTAEEDAIRNFLSGLAMGGLLARNVLATDVLEQGELAQLASDHLPIWADVRPLAQGG